MKNKKYSQILAAALILCLCAAFITVLSPAAEAADGVGTLVDTSELFTERDSEASADLKGAVSLSVSDGETLTIDTEGVYVLSGSASEATVVVDADGAKVQLVLNGLSITNSDFPCLYVKNADKVFVTTAADSSLAVVSAFRADGETNTDGVIFSKDDLVLNGTATLSISSSGNGVVSKDDLKICSGSYVVSASGHALEARDSVRIAGGSLDLTAGRDGVHADNDEDEAKGWIYVSGGELTIRASDDGIHALSFVQIDGGSFSIRASEGIEGTYVLLNDGEIEISATDDGINAAHKSSAYRPTVEINGGALSITMGAGDTDGVDSNGDLIVNGGTISVTGSSSFDADGTVSFNGGTVYVNGSRVSTIPLQVFGGGRGSWGGGGADAVSGATPSGGGRH